MELVSQGREYSGIAYSATDTSRDITGDACADGRTDRINNSRIGFIMARLSQEVLVLSQQDQDEHRSETTGPEHLPNQEGPRT